MGSLHPSQWALMKLAIREIISSIKLTESVVLALDAILRLYTILSGSMLQSGLLDTGLDFTSRLVLHLHIVIFKVLIEPQGWQSNIAVKGRCRRSLLVRVVKLQHKFTSHPFQQNSCVYLSLQKKTCMWFCLSHNNQAKMVHVII